MVLSQRIGYVFGAVYVLVGLAGFAVTSGVGFAESQGGSLLLFEVNNLHNFVHLLVGIALMGGAMYGRTVSMSVNLAIGAVYLAVGAAGFLVPAESVVNILAVNVWDNFLHLASAGVLLASGAYDVVSRRSEQAHTSRPSMDRPPAQVAR